MRFLVCLFYVAQCGLITLPLDFNEDIGNMTSLQSILRFGYYSEFSLIWNQFHSSCHVYIAGKSVEPATMERIRRLTIHASQFGEVLDALLRDENLSKLLSFDVYR